MKKRVGILTFPHSPSFGASLQMTALHHILKKQGYDVAIVNYINDFMREKKHISGEQKKSLKKVVSELLSWPSRIRFIRFESKLSYYPRKTIHDPAELSIMKERFDKISCGSDQVWNPDITGNDMSYFLDFCEPCQRMSYAPSFGVTELEPKYAPAIAAELKQFSALSVRECEGREIVKKLTGAEAQVVLDPTMLVDAEEWRAMEKKPSFSTLPQHYIAYFVFRPNAYVGEFVRKLTEKTGLKVIRYTWSAKESLFRKDCVGQYGPREWMWFLSHADYVVTDSFHGSVFSLLFHREVFVSLASKTNSRMKYLMSQFELQDHVLCEGEPMPSLDKSIDFQRFEVCKKEKVDRSMAYLIRAIEKE